jgi:hypothetical protein
MGSFDWIELDTLTREIEHSRSRLDAARATNNHGLVTLLQREIAEKSERRSRVLLDITKALGISAKTKRHSGPVRAAQTQATDAEHTSNEYQGEGHRAEHGEPGTTEGIRPPEPLQQTVVKEGVADMWNQVTAADLELARGAVAKRLSEMLARHAEELRALLAVGRAGRAHRLPDACAPLADPVRWDALARRPYSAGMQTRLTELLEIEHPVMLAGMGGVSYHQLVAAVSEVGKSEVTFLNIDHSLMVE